MSTEKTTTIAEAVRNLIVCDTQFGWTGETTLKLPELVDLQARGWLVEGAENSEFELTEAGRAVVAQALQSAVPATLATVKPGGTVQLASPSPFPLVDLLDIRNQLHVMVTTMLPNFCDVAARLQGQVQALLDSQGLAMANSFLRRSLYVQILEARRFAGGVFFSNILSQCFQTLLSPRRELYELQCIGLRAIPVVGPHPFNRRLDDIQKFESKLYPSQRQFLPPALCHTFDGGKRTPRIRVEELPGRQNIQKGERIVVRESLQPVSATSEKNEVVKGLATRVALNYVGGNWLRVEWIPITKSRYQLTPPIGELLSESARQLRSRYAVSLPARSPLPLLNVFGLRPFRGDRDLSGLGLLGCSQQSHYHSNESYCCGCPPANSRDGSPIEITGIALFETWSQVLKSWHMHSPLRTGRHSATACHRQEREHG